MTDLPSWHKYLQPEQWHEAAHVFPLMDDKALAELAEHIRHNGLAEPVMLINEDDVEEGDKVLDGRNRLFACVQAEVEPAFLQWEDTAWCVSDWEPVDWVVARNVKRRHLTTEQRGMVAYRLLPIEKKRAAERLLDAQDRGRLMQHITGLPQNWGSPAQPGEEGLGVGAAMIYQEAVDAAGKQVGVSGTNVQYIVGIANAAPELLERLDRAELNIPVASELAKVEDEEKRRELTAKATERKGGKQWTAADARRQIRKATTTGTLEAKAVPEGRFSCIEADPPWGLNAAEGKSAALQYHTMELDEIKDLGAQVLARAADDCHLYLWAINAMLPEALEVMNAWGFTYKTCITWVKPSIGTGHYYRNATEQCLFGVRGKLPCLRQDQANWFRAARGRHSQKPDEFYEIVERMSPGPRLRLFARAEREGWASWINEAEQLA